MTTWILVYIVWGSSCVTTGHIDGFLTLKECEQASVSITRLQSYGPIPATCVQQTVNKKDSK